MWQEFVHLPRYALSQTAKWPYMGILLEQEMGVIGWLRADVSAYVTHQMGGEAVCSDVPLEVEFEILQFIFRHI